MSSDAPSFEPYETLGGWNNSADPVVNPEDVKRTSPSLTYGNSLQHIALQRRAEEYHHADVWATNVTGTINSGLVKKTKVGEFELMCAPNMIRK